VSGLHSRFFRDLIVFLFAGPALAVWILADSYVRQRARKPRRKLLSVLIWLRLFVCLHRRSQHLRNEVESGAPSGDAAN